MLIRITAPHFCAGIDTERKLVAPIIRYMRDWSLTRIESYCRKKGWVVQVFQ
jgi:hypothetical protein